nr:hypothetical protein [Tanacetum cinerariifolium]
GCRDTAANSRGVCLAAETAAANKGGVCLAAETRQQIRGCLFCCRAANKGMFVWLSSSHHKGVFVWLPTAARERLFGLPTAATIRACLLGLPDSSRIIWGVCLGCRTAAAVGGVRVVGSHNLRGVCLAADSSVGSDCLAAETRQQIRGVCLGCQGR